MDIDLKALSKAIQIVATDSSLSAFVLGCASVSLVYAVLGNSFNVELATKGELISFGVYAMACAVLYRIVIETYKERTKKK